MPSSGMLRRVVLLRTDVSEESIATIIRVKGIGELDTTLAVTSNRSTLRYVPPKHQFLTRVTRRNIPEDGILQHSSYTITLEAFMSLAVNILPSKAGVQRCSLDISYHLY
jgi:hypothetical protein